VALLHAPLHVQRGAQPGEKSSLAQKSSEPTMSMWISKNGDTHATGHSRGVAPRGLEGGPSWGFESDPVSIGIVPPLKQVWATPLIDAEQNVIVQAGDGEIHKFTREGVELWQTQTGVIMGANIPALMDNVLYTLGADGIFRAFNASTGSLVWQNMVGDDGAFNDGRSILAVNGMLFTSYGNAQTTNYLGGTGAPSVIAVNASDGSLLWRWDEHTVMNFLAAFHEDSVLFVDDAGTMYRLRASDGSVVWKQAPDIAPELMWFGTGGIAMDMHGNVYATHNYKTFDNPGPGVVTARRFSDGGLLWSRRLSEEANAAPAVANLDGENGGPLAVFVGLGPNPNFPPTDPRPLIWQEGIAMALDAATGETLWEHTFPPWFGLGRNENESTPCVNCFSDAFGNPSVDGNGTAYFGRADGYIYAIHDDNHDGQIAAEEVSSYDLEHAFQSSPAISDGMLAVTPCNGLRVFLSS